MTDSENQEKISSTSTCSEKSTSQDHVSCDKTSEEQPSPSVHNGNSQDISSSSSSEDTPSSSQKGFSKLFWVIILIIGILFFWIYKEAYTDELERLVKRAESGELEAQIDLGNMYYFGRDSVPKDYLQAAKWLRLAAEQGAAEKGDAEQRVAEARYNLGILYVTGEGVAQDYAEAAKWFRMAAEQGIAEAQYNLGLAYSNGRGVAQDYAEAVKWYRKAAEQGIAEAQYNLGVMYANGEGVPRDYQEAAKWFRMAADHGLAEAQEALRRLGK